MLKIVHGIEGLNIWVGRAFGWCILILTLSVSYEVFMRYVLNSPTVWAFDMMIQMYGALFLMAGPYALAQDTHVRADVLYRLFTKKWQARLDFLLYLLFFPLRTSQLAKFQHSVDNMIPLAVQRALFECRIETPFSLPLAAWKNDTMQECIQPNQYS